ncbi:MAG: DUF2946 domain-containing protein [Polaromonas sp.]
MGLNRLTRCFAAWIACFAILLASLAPSISQTLAAARDSGSVQTEGCPLPDEEPAEVDSAANLNIHAGHGDNGAPSTFPKASHFEHCPFCFTHAGSFALVQSVPATLLEASGFSEFPFLFFQAPRLLFVWVAAQARAPPAVS